MVLSRRYIPAAVYLILALLCAALGLLLALSVPEVGRSLNPFITLVLYLLPVLACMLMANGIYLVYLSSRRRPARNLHDVVVQGMLQRWRKRDDRIRAERCEQLQDNDEIE